MSEAYFVYKTRNTISTLFLVRLEDIWIIVDRHGKIHKIQNKINISMYDDFVRTETLTKISKVEAISKIAKPPRPQISDDWEFVDSNPRRPNVGEYFVTFKDNTVVQCDHTYHIPVGKDDRRYIVKKKNAPMLIKSDTTYITAGGYLIEFDEVRFPKLGDICSPGLTDGLRQKAPKKGWHWEADGTILGLTTEWCEKLRIIGESSVKIPNIPKGYRYPQYRKVQEGEFLDLYWTWTDRVKQKEAGQSVFEVIVLEKEEEEITIQQAVISNESKIQKALQYFVVDPAKDIELAFQKSIRPLMLITVVAAVIYTAFNPSIIKSCLPKIQFHWRQ